MEKSLKDKTISGFAWSGLDKTLQQVLVFVCGVLMARRLLDTDYGLAGVLSIFTYLANAFQDSGFMTALIRKKDTNQDDYNSAFYFNISVAVFLYLVLFFSAPFIGQYYEEPKLVNLSRFVFLSFVFNAFALVQTAQVLKKINYKLMAKVNLLSIAISYVVALSLAYTGFGPWAIVAQTVAITACKSLFLWIFNSWRPTWSFKMESFRGLFGFGSNLLLSNILNTITVHIIPSIIGKCYTMGQAGYYTQANRLYNTALDLLAGTVHSVTYPVLSAVEQKERLKRIYRKIMRMNAFLTFPFYLGIALVAYPAIYCLLGEKWIESAPILQILAIGGIFYSLNYPNSHILKIEGKAFFILKFEIFRNILILGIVTLCIFLKTDYLYLISGLTIVSFINYIIQSIICGKLIHYKMRELTKDLYPYLSISLLAVFCGYLLKYFVENQWLLLISQVILVAGIYIVITYFTGSVIMKELIALIKSRISK